MNKVIIHYDYFIVNNSYYILFVPSINIHEQHLHLNSCLIVIQ